MLKRSFKASKCKTALKLAAARIKLLRNKRDSQLKQMKRDIAQLLQAGQEQTARIRVEHVVREENTMAAYDIIELYCELIAARLPIIESQKHCPIDLREAITSVVFASPRCADLPELQDICKLFTAKYGKEFINSALELRPDCGVSRTIVEKLSARAPNGETKIKILTAIAQEHNVEWDPAAAEEQILKPPEDLLNGPSKFMSASKLPTESPDVQFPSPPSHKPEVSMKSSENNVKRESPSSNIFSSGSMSTGSKPSTSPFPEPRRTSESRTEGGEFQESRYKDNSASLNRHNWNMEFKDATSAARAAAESAERASFAARAAAELSSHSRFPGQHSTEPQPQETSYGSSYEETKSSSPVTNTHVSEDLGKVDGFSQRSSNVKKNNLSEATGSGDTGRENVDIRSSRSASSLSSINSTDDEISLVNPKKTDGFSRKSSSGVEAVIQDQQSSKTEKEHYVGGGSVKKQSSQSVSSGPSMSVFADDTSDQNFKKYAGVVVNEHASIHTEGNADSSEKPRSSHYSTPAFDDYDDLVSESNWEMESENMNNKFEYDSYFPEGRKSPTGFSSNTVDSHNPREHRGGSLGNVGLNALLDGSRYSQYPAKLAESNPKPTKSRSNDLLPANYDDSEGLDSESEEENLKQSIRTENSHLHRDWIYSEYPSETAERNPKPTTCSQSNDSLPADYDSDGMDSESEGQILKQSIRTEGSNLPRKQKVSSGSLSPVRNKSSRGSGFSFRGKKETERSVKKLQSRSSSDDSDSSGTVLDKKRSDLVGESRKKHSSRENFSNQKSVKSIKSPRKTNLVEDEFDVPLSPASSKDSNFSNYSSFESGQELTLGRLKGGLRNKGFTRPPYVWSPLGDDSPTVERKPSITSLDNTSTNLIDDSTVKKIPAVSSLDKFSNSSRAGDQESYIHQKPHVEAHKTSNLRTHKSYFDSDSDEAEEKQTRQFDSPTVRKSSITSLDNTSTNLIDDSTVKKKPAISSLDKFSNSSRAGDQKPYIYEKPHVEAHKDSNLRTHKTYFDSDSDEAEEKQTRQTPSRRVYKGGKLSYRSRYSEDSPSQSNRGNTARHSDGPESQVSTDRGASNKPSRQSLPVGQPSMPVSRPVTKESLGISNRNPVIDKPFTTQPHHETSDSDENSRRPQNSSAVHKPSKPLQQTETSASNENVRSTQHGSADGQASRPHPKAADSGNTESLKSSSSGVGLVSRENSINSPSHVHPKLPDYDTFAAHFASLRSNRPSQ